MTGHQHEWRPLTGFRAVYVCACKATGYRNSAGSIVPHRQTIAATAEVNVRGLLPGDGRVPPAPGAE